MTNREKLLKKRPRELEIDGDKILVRSLTIAESIRVDALQKADDREGLASFVISRVLVEADGSQIFTDETDPAIQEVPLELVTPILEKVLSLTKTKSVDTIAKNSDATP